MRLEAERPEVLVAVEERDLRRAVWREIGLVVHRRGTESLVLAGTGQVITDGFQILTPRTAVWYDAMGRWVKGSCEIRGEWIDYVFDV